MSVYIILSLYASDSGLPVFNHRLFPVYRNPYGFGKPSVSVSGLVLCAYRKEPDVVLSFFCYVRYVKGHAPASACSGCNFSKPYPSCRCITVFCRDLFKACSSGCYVCRIVKYHRLCSIYSRSSSVVYGSGNGYARSRFGIG